MSEITPERKRQILQRVLRVHDRLLKEETDDVAIALLEAWAGLGDVLSCYQDRVANEAYLRTEPRSEE